MKLKEILEESFTISMEFTNLTSETIVNDPVWMISVEAKGCLLNVPPKTCSKGHQVQIRLCFKSQSNIEKMMVIDIIGKISELVPTEDGRYEIKVQFYQFIKEEWQLFLEAIDRKQNMISSILKKLA